MLLSKVAVFAELHRQRQLLHRRNEKLERVLELNETMIAVLTHDLRTPLSAIMMCAEVIRIHAAEGPAAKSVARLKSSAQRMARMIEQLLDFSRIRSDILRLDLKDADLAPIAGAVVAELRQARPEAAIDVESRGDLAGRFDPERIGQVIANLLGNAVQHGAPGAPVRPQLDGTLPGRLRLSVTNAGLLRDDLLPQIFMPFKGAGRSGEGLGLGLGLYIVEQFVPAHGGAVRAANTADGVRLDVDLPRHARA